ncbi:hypothetical protein CAI21_19400 [Alkalilimnicola ehrlichii]|uniref:Fibronectin type-III domain-containing protein n=1 Tax=Alkalilimnicola ehrlichii TaxID=351052 RepID=A0A3E0WHU6_9GAMM|nr:fibronectin type III domain-containing protein [Alkalilimnicola ehrlichii]RFA25351.1 hypothetical protein CAI21_19400 [Alkalilimnicola ehrlichii]RFA31536.1 hypothetical protein CAL65_22375 [Alkalilimnicola ehrlichii]
MPGTTHSVVSAAQRRSRYRALIFLCALLLALLGCSGSSDDDPAPTPGAVTDLSATMEGSGVRLQWSAPNPADNVAQYRVYRGEINGGLSRLAEVAAADARFVDAEPANGTVYRYRVVALNRDNQAGPAAEVEFFVAYNTTPVRQLSVSRDEWYGKLRWQPESGYRYQVFRGTSRPPKPCWSRPSSPNTAMPPQPVPSLCIIGWRRCGISATR